MDDVADGPTSASGLVRVHPDAGGREPRPDGITEVRLSAPGRRSLLDPVRRAGPGRRRPVLFLEGLAAYLVGLATSFAFLPALRDRKQAVYYDVLIHGIGPDHHGIARLLRDGTLPLWVNNYYAGEPYLANLQHGLLYPGNVLFWILPTSTAFDLTIAAHLAWAVLGMWAFCRFVLRVGTWGAAIGALTFAFGGHLLQHVILTNQLQGMSWIPWILLTAHLALERGKLRWTVLSAVAIGLQFLCGHPEAWVYTVGALGLFTVCWALAVPRDLPRRAVRALVQVGGALALFVLLFSWQLLPSLQLKGQSYRSAPGFHQQYPLPKAVAVNTLLPDYGHVLVGENVGFVGILALGLFALGLAARRPDLRWMRAWLALLAAFGFVMAMGNSTAFYRFLYDHAPLVSGFRVPARYLVLTTFALAAGAALGADELLQRSLGQPRARVGQGLVAAAILLGGAAFAFSLGNFTADRTSYLRWLVAALAGLTLWLLAGIKWLPRAALGVLLLVVAGTELRAARPFAEYRQKAPNQVYDDSSGVLDAIARGGGRYVSVAGPPTPAQRTEIPVPRQLTGGRANYYVAGVLQQLTARPNTSQAVMAETPVSRDGGLMPLTRYRDFWVNATGADPNIAAGTIFTPPSRWRWDSLDLLAVRWFVTSDQLPAAERAVLEQHGFRPAGHYAFVFLWERPAPPLARLVTDVRVAPSAGQQLAELRGDLDLTRSAVVGQQVGVDRTASTGSADVVTRTTSRVVVRTSSPGRSLLVLADPYYPGWTATVDGRPARILPADHAFRGVEVPAGAHTVSFRYSAPPFRHGLFLAGVTTLALVAAGVLGPRLRRRPAGRRRGSGGREPA